MDSSIQDDSYVVLNKECHAERLSPWAKSKGPAPAPAQRRSCGRAAAGRVQRGMLHCVH